jgi:hypothetical protein
MKTALLMTAALLVATPAWTCDDDHFHMCQGHVLVNSFGHVEIVSKDEICTIYNKAIIKRLLKVCPYDGSQCEVILDRKEYRTDKRGGQNIGPVLEITKWPGSIAVRNKP